MNRTSIYILIVFLWIIGTIYSQSIPQYLLTEPEKYIPEDETTCMIFENIKKNLVELQSKTSIVRRPYNVLSYNLFMDWYEPLSKPEQSRIDTTIFRIDTIRDNEGKIVKIDTTKRTDTTYYLDAHWKGINEIMIQIDSANINRIEFDNARLKIDSVFAAKTGLELEKMNTSKYFTSGNILFIILPEGIIKSDSVLFRIHFSYESIGNQGFFLYRKNLVVDNKDFPDDTLPERIAYTMSEPVSSRYWMPCNDVPHDKAIAKISVRVPNGFTVASNGILEEIKSDDVSKTYIWSDDAPITTYLMSASASKFIEFSDWYTRISNPDDKVEVKYYVWEDDYNNTDTDGSKYNAKYSFRNMVAMLELYSEIYGEYPFKKYGMAVVQPFGFGGMEHQTMTTVNRSWLRGWSDDGIAHELVHQWLGDLVTCATWNDIWLNEGGATWGTAFWWEKNWGDAAYYSYMWWQKQTYFIRKGVDSVAIYYVPLGQIFGSKYHLVYQKASWVYHMLLEMLGRERFFEALHYLLDKYKFNSIETYEFMESFKEAVPNVPIQFETFFDQWIYKAGYPKYYINTQTYNIGDKYRVDINIEQLQKLDHIPNIPDVFKMPLHLMFSKDSVVRHNEIVLDTLEKQTFEFVLDFRPDQIMIDTNKVLCEIVSSIVSVHEKNKIPAESNVYPNPITSGTIGEFVFNTVEPGFALIEIIDHFGRLVKKIYDGYLPEGSHRQRFSTLHLTSGAYLIRCKTIDGVTVARFAVVK